MAEGTGTGDSFNSINIPSDFLNNFMETDGAGFFATDFSFGSMAGSGASGPFLEILEQPKQRGFRFRYSCEGPSHGGLPGERSERGKKSYPSVQINNYAGKARIEVTLVTVNDPPQPHAHSLVGKNVQDGACLIEIGPEQGMTATFPNLGIQHITKKNVKAVLTDRYTKQHKLEALARTAFNDVKAEQAVNSSQASCSNAAGSSSQASIDKNVAASIRAEEIKNIEKIVEQQAKTMNLSAVRLCFQTYLPDEQGHFVRCLAPVYSQEIYDSKAASASELKICRIDRQAGSVNGGDEVFLLCDKVQKDDIEVRFYEETAGRQWEDFGKFSTSDVHRQFAIVFKTPEYWNKAIEKPVTVSLELRRKSDKERSNTMDFIYKPNEFDPEHIGAKRRKKVPHFGDYTDQGGSGMGGGAGAGGGGGGNLPFLDPTSLSQFFAMFPPSAGGPSGSGGVAHSHGQPPPQDEEEPLRGEDRHSYGTKGKTERVSMEVISSALSCAMQQMVTSTKCLEHFSQTNDLRYILAAQRHHAAVPNDDGDSALHISIINGHPHIVKGLLDVTTNMNPGFINQFNFLRQSALHLAVITQQPNLIGRLLQAGADVTLQDRHGNTPLHLASQQNNPACLNALVNRPPSRIFTRQSNKYPELNFQNYDGLCAVHLAVMSDRPENLKILNSIEADMDARDGKSGYSPLHHAVEANNLALAGYLTLTANVDIDSPSTDGNTALHLASGLGLKSITALLVAAGANLDVVNNEDESPLDLATSSEVCEVLEGKVGTSLVSTVSSRMNNLSITNESRDMKDTLDLMTSVERGQIESLVSNDWKSLAERLGLSSYLNALALQKNPAKHLLDAYETVDGSAQKLRDALVDLGNRNAARIVDKCLESTDSSQVVARGPKSVLLKDSGHFSESFDTDSAYGSMSTSDRSLPSYQSLRESKKGLRNSYDPLEETVEPQT